MPRFEVEYVERDLAPVEVPATNDGVRHALTDLRYAGQGEEYIFLAGHNGSDYAILVHDAAGGRRWRIKSGLPLEIDLEPGVTHLAIEPVGGNIGASEVVLQPTVRTVKRA